MIPSSPDVPATADDASVNEAPDATVAQNPDASPVVDAGVDVNPDPFADLPSGAAQLMLLCARHNGDVVARAFCASSTPPVITSLTDLLALLGLDFKPGVIANGSGGNPAFSALAHSSSLVARVTSAINPRIFVMTPPASISGIGQRSPMPFVPNPEFVITAFARGEQQVEIASKDPSNGGAINFYLFTYQQACNSSPNGCSNADRFLPRAESGFTGYTLYQDTDLQNTQFACETCHQPQGKGTPKILRQREQQYFWMHWINFCGPAPERCFSDADRGILAKAYIAAHGTETYGGVPIVNLSAPVHLQGLIENNYGYNNEPDEFPTGRISGEDHASNPGAPLVNDPPSTSATWQAMYDRAKSGETVLLPYVDVSAADATKLANATSAYQAVVAGTMSPAQLPDLSDVFLNAALPKLLFRPDPSLNGRGIIVEMCHQCHNSGVDRSLSRSNFDVDRLDQLPQGEKNVAIQRLMLPATAARHMPPHRFRELAPSELNMVVQYLMQ
jgi:hypothetical protein